MVVRASARLDRGACRARPATGSFARTGRPGGPNRLAARPRAPGPTHPLGLEVVRRAASPGSRSRSRRGRPWRSGPRPGLACRLPPRAGRHARLGALVGCAGRRSRGAARRIAPRPRSPPCRWCCRCGSRRSGSGAPARRPPAVGAVSTSVAVGPLLFAFFAVFPRRAGPRPSRGCCRAGGRWRGTCAWGYHIAAAGRRDRASRLGRLGVRRQRRRTPCWPSRSCCRTAARRRTLTERRRTRVLAVGTVVGAAAGAAAVARYWRNPVGGHLRDADADGAVARCSWRCRRRSPTPSCATACSTSG